MERGGRGDAEKPLRSLSEEINRGVTTVTEAWLESRRA